MTAPVTGLTVLYADDEDSDRMFMERAFRQAGLGHVLRTVTDGQEAKDYLRGHGVYEDRNLHPLPAVLLLDLKMPLLGGFEVLEWIRMESDLRRLPVVIFTSSPRVEDKAKAKELGANDFVEKPSAPARYGDVVLQLRDKWL